MRKLIFLTNLLLLSVFASAQVDSASVFIYGWIENLGGASVDVNVTLSDGQSTTVLAQNGFYSAVFLSPGDFGTATSSIVDCNGNEVSGSAEYQLFDAVQINLLYCGNAIVFGCTDPEALNYNADATDDDGSCVYPVECNDNLVTFTMTTAIWAEEIYWSISDPDSSWFGGYSDNSVSTDVLCLENGCYTITMYDSFGDGWNGGVLTVDVNGTTYTTTLNTGSVGTFTFGINTEGCVEPLFGCTDPTALNYNPEATIDDGSCQYSNGCECT
ncbi:MAG: hypothetical protein KDC12_15715, partial [Flavobacteriales bacterium]|nr:hypothetical protein [Flavobacteriales bacterium]